jgi:erythromycin esterase-like protein
MMPVKLINGNGASAQISLSMVALLVTLFGYTGYIATQLGGVQQQVITSTKTLDETKAATERLSLESRATASVLASESRATTEKLAADTKTATGLLAAESRAATEKLAFEAAAKAAALAAADTILRERVTRLETQLSELMDNKRSPQYVDLPSHTAP